MSLRTFTTSGFRRSGVVTDFTASPRARCLRSFHVRDQAFSPESPSFCTLPFDLCTLTSPDMVVLSSSSYVTAEPGFVVESSFSGSPTEGRPFPGPFLPSLFTA